MSHISSYYLNIDKRLRYFLAFKSPMGQRQGHLFNSQMATDLWCMRVFPRDFSSVSDLHLGNGSFFALPLIFKQMGK